MNTKLWILMLAIAVAGCNDNNNNGNGSHDMAMGGDGDGGVTDMTPPNDLTDTTPIPAPTATHVGATGATCCLVTDFVGKNAAYLLNAAPVTKTVMGQMVPLGNAGELHLVTSDGTDKMIAAGVFSNGYAISPDGKALFYVAYNANTGFTNGTATLQYYAIGGAGTSTTAIASGLAQNIAPNAFVPVGIGSNPAFSPSSNYFLQATYPPTVQTVPDLHIIDVHTGMDVLQRTAGGDAYMQLILPDDTLLFQDVVGGTGTPPTTPVQTLFWVKLGGSAAPATLTTHTSQFLPTIDNKTIVILKTSGDLLTWDVTAKTGSGTKIASGAVSMTIGTSPTGPIAYTGADASVHVLGTDGTKLLDLPTAKADLLGTPVLSQDNAHVYFWQNYESQNNRGTLMHAPVTSGGAATKIGDKISFLDLGVTDTALVFVTNVDDMGQFGDVATAGLDGSNIVALGTKANVGGLRVANPGPATWFAMHLTNAATDTNTTIDGSPSILGGLAFADYTGAMELALDAKVQASGFEFSDDGRDAAYVTGATFASGGYAGSLAFLATRAPSMKIDGKLTGVTQLGPIVNRSLFVNAPTATTAGVYFVKY